MEQVREATLKPGEANDAGLGRWGRAFVLVMVGYSGARAVLVGQTLGEYGVNPWLFLLIDAGSAIPLATGQVQLLQALRRRDPAQMQRALLTVGAAFLAPYAYLVLGGNKPLPTSAYAAIAVLVAVVGVATAWRVRSEARASAVVRT